MDPVANKSIEFLQDWRPGGPWILTSVVQGKRGIETQTFTDAGLAHAWIEAEGRKKRNIYFHVNSCMAELSSKARKADIRSMDWIHVDLDPAPGEDINAERARLLALLQKDHDGVPPPTMILFSGGGYWGFWRLKEPIEINGDEAKAADAERYNLQLELRFQADSCHNVDRIARLPGTVNYPDEKKRRKGQVECVAEVIAYDAARTYDLSEFMQAPEVSGSIGGDEGQNAVPVNVPTGNVRRIDVTNLDGELPAGVSSRCKVAIMQGYDDEQPLTGGNSASEWLWYVVNELVRNECSDELIYSIITDPNLKISDHIRKQGNSRAQERAAVRAIRRAREAEIDPRLEQMNGKFAAVMSVGGKFRIVREYYDPALEQYDVEFLLPDGFKLAHCNQSVEVVVQTAQGTGSKLIPLGRWWLEHAHRRQYESILFYPNKEFDAHLNLWRGYGCDAIPGDCSLFLEHVKSVLCKGHQEHYEFMLGWMANAVQNPAMPGQTAIVMRGGQGTGKGTFANTFGHLFGTHYKYVNNPDHVTGQFNIMLQTAVFVFADECFTVGPKHAAALKSLITEPQLRVEAKGLDTLTVRNCVHLCMATNREWAVDAEMDDRRFFVVDVDGERASDTEYFGRIKAQMESGGYEALLHFLLNYDLSGFNPFKCPKTDELRRQQNQSMDWMQRGWLHCLEEGKLMHQHDGWRTWINKNELTAALLVSAGKERVGMGPGKQFLGEFLNRLVNVRGDRKHGAKHTWVDLRGQVQEESRTRVWDFPSLAECRRLWELAYGEREWPPVEDDTGNSTPDPDQPF